MLHIICLPNSLDCHKSSEIRFSLSAEKCTLSAMKVKTAFSCQTLHMHDSTHWNWRNKMENIFWTWGALYIVLHFGNSLVFISKCLIYCRCCQWNILFGLKGSFPRAECSSFVLLWSKWAYVGMFSVEKLCPINKRASVCVCCFE